MMRRTGLVDVSPHLDLPSRIGIRQLRAFVTLADLGIMTAAARRLGLAQSTVSEAISALERAVGAPVLVRRRGRYRAVLTTAGNALLPHARRILEAMDAAGVAVAKVAKDSCTCVDIVANESVSAYVLPSVLARLREEWRDTQFSVSVGTGARIRDGVAAGVFDVGLLLDRAGGCEPMSPAGPSRMFHRQVVGDVELVMFARPSHPRAGGMCRRRTLAPFPLFVSDAALEFRAFMRRYGGGRHQLSAPRLEAVGSVGGVKQAVITEEGGLGLLPAYALTEDLRMGRFVRLDLQPPPPDVQLRALLLPARIRHPATAAVLDAVRKNLSCL